MPRQKNEAEVEESTWRPNQPVPRDQRSLLKPRWSLKITRQSQEVPPVTLFAYSLTRVLSRQQASEEKLPFGLEFNFSSALGHRGWSASPFSYLQPPVRLSGADGEDFS